MNFRRKTYYLAGAFILLIALIVGLGIFPVVSQINSQSQELAHQKQLIDSFFRNWQDSATAEKDYQEIKNQLSQAQAILPAQQAIDYILMVEKFAQATNNDHSITVTAANSADASANLGFQIVLRGSFPDLIKFLVHLENAPYYSNVKSFQVSRVSRLNGNQIKGAEEPQIGEVNSLLNVAVYQNATSTN